MDLYDITFYFVLFPEKESGNTKVCFCSNAKLKVRTFSGKYSTSYTEIFPLHIC